MSDANTDGPTIENADAANEALDALLEQPRPEFDEFPEATQQSVKHRLEQKRAESAQRTVKVLGEPVEFKQPGANVSRRATELRQRALDSDDPSAEAELYDFVFQMLANHSLDPEMDAEWWGEFSFGTLLHVFEDLVIGDVDEEVQAEIDGFREE